MDAYWEASLIDIISSFSNLNLLGRFDCRILAVICKCDGCNLHRIIIIKELKSIIYKQNVKQNKQQLAIFIRNKRQEKHFVQT